MPKTRLVLFEAAIAMVNGLGFERALRSITIDAARLLSIDKIVGSLDVGKMPTSSCLTVIRLNIRRIFRLLF